MTGELQLPVSFLMPSDARVRSGPAIPCVKRAPPVPPAFWMLVELSFAIQATGEQASIGGESAIGISAGVLSRRGVRTMRLFACTFATPARTSASLGSFV